MSFNFVGERHVVDIIYSTACIRMITDDVCILDVPFVDILAQNFMCVVNLVNFFCIFDTEFNVNNKNNNNNNKALVILKMHMTLLTVNLNYLNGNAIW